MTTALGAALLALQRYHKLGSPAKAHLN
jgi:hypothetical protein